MPALFLAPAPCRALAFDKANADEEHDEDERVARERQRTMLGNENDGACCQKHEEADVDDPASPGGW